MAPKDITATTFFSPSIGAGATKPKPSNVTSRLNDSTPYYVFPNGLNREDGMTVGLACMISCTSTDATIREWKSLILTYTNVLFNGLVSKLPSSVATPVAFPRDKLDRLRQLADSYRAVEIAADGNTSNPHSNTALSEWHMGDILPTPASPMDCGFLMYSRDSTVIAGHYSLLVFLAGKEIRANERTPITTSRPRAIIEKYKIESPEFLTGNLRMSDHSHQSINQAWLEMTALKSLCFREFSTYSHIDTDLTQDILLTTVNLMRYMQMAHATIIYKFILAYPWVLEWGPLQKYVSTFEQSLDAVSKIEPHVQPFVKIIYGDKAGIFPRKELLPLIACALEAEEETTDTLAGYYHDSSFGSVVEAFKEERDKRAEAGKARAQPPLDATHHPDRITGTGTRTDDVQPAAPVAAPAGPTTQDTDDTEMTTI